MTPANNSIYRTTDKKSMYASLLLLLTIGITFFVASDLYSTYATSSEEKAQLDSKAMALNEELKALNEKKQKVENDKSTKEAIAQFASEYREDLILSQIYAKTDGIIIKDIGMEKGQRLPNGLSLANITINVDAKTLGDMNRYLSYLTQESSKIRFVIKSANLPFNSENTNSTISADLSLGMYYFEQ